MGKLAFGPVVAAIYVCVVLAFSGVMLAASCEPLIEPLPNRLTYAREPVVGVRDPVLMQAAEWSVNAWDYGALQSGCDGADICVRVGMLEPGGPLGRAYWGPGIEGCKAEVMFPRWEIVAHEIGHCFGLGHSRHSQSVMYPTVDNTFDSSDVRYVTRSDLEALEAIK